MYLSLSIYIYIYTHMYTSHVRLRGGPGHTPSSGMVGLNSGGTTCLTLLV